jgi:hypothetical protein
LLLGAGFGEGAFGAEEIDGMLFLVEAVEIGAILGGTLASGLGEDGPQSVEGESLSLGGRQGAVVKAEIIEGAGEPGVSGARTDAKGLGGGDGIREGIAFDIQIAGLTIDIDAEAGGFAGAVVGDQDMAPVGAFELLSGEDLEGVLGVLVDQVDDQASVLDQEIKASMRGAGVHATEEGAMTLDLHPSAEAEGVGSIEGDQGAEIEMRAPVQFQGFAEATGDKLRGIVAKESRAGGGGTG